MLLENKDNRGSQIVDDDDWRAKGPDTSRLMPGYVQVRRSRVVVVLQRLGSSQPCTKKTVNKSILLCHNPCVSFHSCEL
jgi:hypothetical protein